MTPLSSIIITVFATFFGAGGALFLKKGSDKLSLTLKSLFQFHIFLGLFFYVVSVSLVIYALKKGELSIIYPIGALTYIWVTILSAKILKEKISIYQCISVALIFLGVIIISIG
ncbi:EamA family transporter [Candidatus Woesearchaeota archaeon]|nr:EamA family transporter [Candidatus Woesearchaeota archaeon]